MEFVTCVVTAWCGWSMSFWEYGRLVGTCCFHPQDMVPFYFEDGSSNSLRSVGACTPAFFASHNSRPWQSAMLQHSLLQQRDSGQDIAYRSWEWVMGPWHRLQLVLYSHRTCDKMWLVTAIYLVSDECYDLISPVVLWNCVYVFHCWLFKDV